MRSEDNIYTQDPILINENNFNVYDGRYIYSKRTKKRTKPFIYRYAGFDMGRSQDRSVLSLIDECQDGKYRLIGLYKMRNVDFFIQLYRLNFLCRSCEVDKLFYDANALGGKILTDGIHSINQETGNVSYPYIANIAEPVPMNKPLKHSLYNGLKVLMQKKQLYLYSDRDMINEFKNLVHKENGKIQAGTRTYNDDIPASITLCIKEIVDKMGCECNDDSVDAYFL